MKDQFKHWKIYYWKKGYFDRNECELLDVVWTIIIITFFFSFFSIIFTYFLTTFIEWFFRLVLHNKFLAVKLQITKENISRLYAFEWEIGFSFSFFRHVFSLLNVFSFLISRIKFDDTFSLNLPHYLDNFPNTICGKWLRVLRCLTTNRTQKTTRRRLESMHVEMWLTTNSTYLFLLDLLFPPASSTQTHTLSNQKKKSREL